MLSYIKQAQLLFLFSLSIFLLKPEQSQASHAVGGDIYYEYIGDSTGVPHHYKIFLKLYRRTAGISFGPTASIQIKSSCYGTQNLTVTGVVQNLPLNNFDECVDSVFLGPVVSYYVYEATTTLPGLCSDYKFSYSVCCRNGDVTNLINPAAEGIYLEAFLNNYLGPNSSPRIISEGSKAFCILDHINWSQLAEEKDGDSLYYQLIQPLSDENQPIPWAPGYSTAQPITSTNGVVFNSRNGDFTFQPVQQETDMVRIRVTEYRYDTLFATFLKAGHVDRDVQIYILNSCPTGSSAPGITTAGAVPGIRTNIDCGSKYLRLNLSGRIDCRSIAADGSDFAMYNSNNNLIPIIGAGTDSCTGNYTRTVLLQFNDSIYYNDSLYLVSRTGTDLNTLVSACGVMIPENDSIALKVTNCSTSIGLSHYNLRNWQIYPNPAHEHISINLSTSNPASFQILNMNGQIVLSGTLKDISQFIDVSMLESGVYVLKLTNQFSSEARKFIKY